MKTDSSIRNICIASIKRKAKTPEAFLLTRFFEKEIFSEINNERVVRLSCDENELPIAQTIVDESNWTLVTTRQIISCVDDIIITVKASEVISWKWNDFKGYKKTAYTVGQLTLSNNQRLAIFIETGFASMVMIYAIMTLVRLVKNG